MLPLQSEEEPQLFFSNGKLCLQAAGEGQSPLAPRTPRPLQPQRTPGQASSLTDVPSRSPTSPTLVSGQVCWIGAGATTSCPHQWQKLQLTTSRTKRDSGAEPEEETQNSCLPASLCGARLSPVSHRRRVEVCVTSTGACPCPRLVLVRAQQIVRPQ